METRGKLVDASKNIFSGKWRLTFEVDALPKIDTISKKDLRITAVQWREKRSLNANSYFHKLVNEIANTLGSSMTEVKNHLMADYGQLDVGEDGKVQTVIIRDDIPWEKLEWIHLRPTTSTRVLDDNKLYRVFYVIRGSHTYDSKEFSNLLEGTVAECKQLGVETLDDLEMKRLLEAYKPPERKLKNVG